MDHPLQISLNLPAEPFALELARTCLGMILEQVYDPKDAAEEIYKLQLALHEIMVNIIRHAYADQPAGRIEVSLNLLPDPDRLMIELHDTGVSFDLDQAPDPDPQNLQEGGYGLFLARSVTDEMTYQPQTGNNCWRLVKKLPGK